MINPAQYEGKAIKGSVQFGETNNSSLQIAIDMELRDSQKQVVGQMTTFLYFTEGSAVYSYERLRTLGWKGQSADDIDKLDDIFDAWVPVRVTAPEPYKGPDGTMKTGNSKLEILTGAGTVIIEKKVDINTFKARLRAVNPGSRGSGSPPGNSGGSAPPF